MDVVLSLRVHEALRQSPYQRLHLVSTEVLNGVAVLSGRVPSFHVKQAAQCILAELDGLGRVDNRLDVVG